MKNINKIFIGLATPLLPLATILPMVSCGGPVLEHDLKGDAHVNIDGISLSKIQEGKSFSITAKDPKKFWEKISATITIGDSIFEADRVDDLHLTVPGNKVINGTVQIYVKGEGTFNKTDVSWVNSSSESTWSSIFHVGETIRKSDIWVWTFYGDDELIDENWRQLEPGTATGQYRIYMDGLDNDITTSFAAEGRKITSDDLGSLSGKAVFKSHNFRFMYTIGGKTWIKGDLSAICCNKLTEPTITPISASVDKGASQIFNVEVNAGAFPYFQFEIVNRSGASDTKLESTTERSDSCTVIAGQESGSVTIRATSVDDPTIYKDATLNIA